MILFQKSINRILRDADHSIEIVIGYLFLADEIACLAVAYPDFSGCTRNGIEDFGITH